MFDGLVSWIDGANKLIGSRVKMLSGIVGLSCIWAK